MFCLRSGPLGNKGNVRYKYPESKSRDLDGVERSAFARIIGDDPEDDPEIDAVRFPNEPVLSFCSMGAKKSVIHSDAEILGGTPVFVGTRVPAQALIDYLEAGRPLDEFLDAFPSVTREQAVAVLQERRL